MKRRLEGDEREELESSLLVELSKVNQEEERALADEALAADKEWPDY